MHKRKAKRPWKSAQVLPEHTLNFTNPGSQRANGLQQKWKDDHVLFFFFSFLKSHLKHTQVKNQLVLQSSLITT